MADSPITVAVFTPEQLAAVLAALGKGDRQPESYWLGPPMFDQQWSYFGGSIPAVVCAVANPLRRMLAFACGNTGIPVQVHTGSDVSINRGLQLSAPSLPTVLDYATWGSFVTAQWYAHGTSTWTLTVYELILRPERMVAHGT